MIKAYSSVETPASFFQTRLTAHLFLVPLPVIDQAIDLIMSGDIVHYIYDPAQQDLVRFD